ncbi:amino acid permease [Novosphingobium sp.]|uniref:amino acid permease n=1 Tax=Novosphingobium sp. TaxID=1874826 RepID=UPI00286B5DE2|nr:amino acid permease [Novosphingobium sp.]
MTIYAEADVAAAGDAPGLGQSLENRHVTMITLGGIIGAGLFVGSSTTISQVGPAAVVSFAIAGLAVMLVMRMISEMASSLDGVQAFPDFARAGLGHWAGYLSGWLYWYFWAVVVAIEAVAGAKIINAWYPQFAEWQIGVALMLALTAVNLLSTRTYGEFEFWFSLIKVAAIVAFIALTGAFVFGVTNPDGASIAAWTGYGGFAPKGWGVVLAAVASTIFTMCGAEIATIAAAESKEGAKVIGRLSLSVSIRILFFYVISLGLIVAVLPWNEVQPGYSPFAATLAAIQIPYGSQIMTALVLVAVLSCLNSSLYITSRTLFGLARHGDAPQWLVSVNRRKVPARAIVVASLFSYAAYAAERLSPNTVFSFLINSSGATMLLLYIMCAVSQLRIRRRLEATAPEKLTLKMWLFPWLTLATIGVMAAVLLFMAASPMLASQFWLSLLVAGGLLAAFAVMKKARG